MQLTHHHAFGTVDHERAPVGHHGQSSEVDFLFLDVSYAFGSVLHIRVEYDQPYGEFERCLECHPFVEAIVFIILHIFKCVFDKFQRRGAGEIVNRKYTSERPLQTNLFPIFQRDVFLQKTLV